MDVPEHRRWMYNRTGPRRVGITDVSVKGVDEFIAYACQSETRARNGTIRCPCVKCKCKRFADPDLVKLHLYKNGFTEMYGYWTSHGEMLPPLHPEQSNDQTTCDEGYQEQCNQYEAMVIDAARPSFCENLNESVNEPPNANIQAFYDMLLAADSPLWAKCSNHSELSVPIRMLRVKADYNMPEECFNVLLQLMREIVPPDNRVPLDFYRTKKLVSKLGLGYVKIDCCINGCMLYYKDDENETECKFCGSPRYTIKNISRGQHSLVPNKQMWYLPLIPRLQRLFISPRTANEMRWHHDNHREPGV